MIKTIIAVKDEKAQSFFSPFYFPFQAFALRELLEVANTPSTKLYQWPNDFTVYELGTFDDESGHFMLHDGPEFVISIASLKTSNHFNENDNQI